MTTTFNDTYEIKSLIGRGGMSAVYVAEHRRLHTRWAVKQVFKQQGVRFDFLAEANILKRLQHPMLPRIVDIFEDADSIYLVEDFVEGRTLADWFQTEGRVAEVQGLAWFRALCGVLGYLHSQTPPIIYRDMKPSNIMLQPDGALKLIDFGIAREYKQDAQSDTTYIGTRGYAAPEQFGTAQTDGRTDIYSLGATMYHLLTGKSPYDPPYRFVPARQLVPDLSRGTEHILDRCLQSEPADRYQNVDELIYDLEHSYRFDQAWQKYVRTKRRRRWILAGMLTASIALMAVGRYTMGQEEAARQAAITQEYEALLASVDALYDTAPEQVYSTIQEARSLRPERVESYQQEAYYLYQSGDYQGCAAFASEKLNTFPEDGILLLIRASAQFELGDYAGAAADFYQGAQSEDMSVDHMRDYAVCLGRLGEIDQAQAILEQLADQGAHSDVTDYVRGEVFYAQGDYAQAEGAFRAALEETENASLRRRCYLSLAETYRDTAQYDASIALIDEAFTIPDLQGNTVLYEMLGAALYNRGVQNGNDHADLSRAAECFTRVVQSGMAREYLYVNAFTAWQAIGEYDSAGAILDEMEAVWPESYIPHALRATLYIFQENQKDQGQRDYNAAYQEYLQAKDHIRSEEDATYLQQLEGLIKQLQAGGWLG